MSLYWASFQQGAHCDRDSLRLCSGGATNNLSYGLRRLYERPSRPSETACSSSLEGLEAGELFQKMTRSMKLLLLLLVEGSEVEGDDPELEFMV